MTDNRSNGYEDEFEDIYSNSSQDDTSEDVYSDSQETDEFDKLVSSMEGDVDRDSQNVSQQNYDVKYNSAAQNRDRQEIKYNDTGDVYSDVSSDSSYERTGHPVRNTIIAILCITLVGLTTLGVFGYVKLEKLLSSFGSEELNDNAYMNSADLTKYPDQINVLLIGIDAREGDTASRSDTMMLVTLDKANKQIKLTSFLRDSYVEIVGKNFWSKLNTSYFYGGIQMLSDTLEKNFRVDIQYYALVDFNIFTTIVDKLGGINVDVTKKESHYTYNSGDVGVPVRIPAGKDVHLNGEEALWYSRIRSLDSDFQRTQRQRKVITAIVEKASTKSPAELYSLAQTVIPLVKTNMSSSQIMSLGVSAMKNMVYNYPIVQHQVPADGTWEGKTIPGVGASLVMDLNKNQQLLHRFLSEKQEVENSEK